jgi:phospholipase C
MAVTLTLCLLTQASIARAAGPTTPISHLIVIVGENRSFDNVFGVYSPGAGQSVANLLSRGIVNANGSPGPNFALAAQTQAAGAGIYVIDPLATAPYTTLPRPYYDYEPDTRFPASLPNGPFQITKYVGYKDYTGDPVHRFFQMWQQVDKGRQDLVVWVSKTAGEGPQSKKNTTATSSNTNYSSEGMGFYNMSAGDAPYFNELAEDYAISDNYHQPVMGGTGVNFIFLASGDVAFFNKNGVPAVPWANQTENPNPQPGTDNWYTKDGYAGGSYVKCADLSKPGVPAIMDYLSSLPYSAFNAGNCAASTYYLVNNYNPGYTKTGAPAKLGSNYYVAPPQVIPTIAESLSANGVSWKWYSGGRTTGSGYCSFCDAFVYFKGVMTTPLRDNLQDMTQFWVDVTDEATLPAVVFLRPSDGKSGHPETSTLAAFEGFVKRVINNVKASPAVWAKTAILITMDEAGGYYDSGYIQPIDFFGDGPRIPLIVVSPYARKGYVDHTYGDHTSILKFIEANWGLAPLSDRSRDRLPNPIADVGNPYVPLNRPAIGDLMNLFDFD